MESVKHLRKEAGMTQEELAEKVDCTQSMLSKVERGAVALPSRLAQKIGEVFDVDPSDIQVQERGTQGGSAPPAPKSPSMNDSSRSSLRTQANSVEEMGMDQMEQTNNQNRLWGLIRVIPTTMTLLGDVMSRISNQVFQQPSGDQNSHDFQRLLRLKKRLDLLNEDLQEILDTYDDTTSPQESDAMDV